MSTGICVRFVPEPETETTQKPEWDDSDTETRTA